VKRVWAASALLLSASLAAAATTSSQITLVPTIPSGLTQPVGIANAGDGSNRLFVVEQPGKIRVFENGTLLPTPFIDFGSSTGGLNLISGCTATSCGGERGLLGLAFHPDYATNGFFYVYYTRTNGDIQVTRYHVSADPDIADSASAVPVIGIPHPTNANHNGGYLMFRSFDAGHYLYLGTGDGGSGGDPPENAQSLDVLLGKILRLDIDTDGFPADNAKFYSIPPSNPFAGATPGADEIWAWGLRNPWRWSFDRLTGGLYIGDVGQGLWEEIDFESAASSGGINYGWDCREGAHDYGIGAADPDNEDCSYRTAGNAYVDPILEYGHGPLGCSVTGGFVYRGGTAASIYGQYLFGDHCSGKIWRGFFSGVWTSTEVFDTVFDVAAFGEDEAGKVYVADRTGGAVYRIAPYSFTDVLPDTKPWTPIELAYLNGISLGCASNRFCSDGPVQRQQLPALLLRAQDPGADPAACGSQPFQDVLTGSEYCRWIAAAKVANLTVPCDGGDHLCPTQPVTRGTLAPALYRAVHPASPDPPVCAGDLYADVTAGDPLCRWIKAVVEEGLLPACNEAGSVFCRDAPLRRDQLAAALVNAFPATIQVTTP
jgi:glucose/arabinose dehydrogenase